MLAMIAVYFYQLREVGLPREYILNSLAVKVESIPATSSNRRIVSRCNCVMRSALRTLVPDSRHISTTLRD